MTEPTPTKEGFYLFPDEPACRAWIDAGMAEGGEDPLMVAVFPPDNMLPLPRSWATMPKDQVLELRRLVDNSFNSGRKKDGAQYVGARYFGFMADGKPVAGGLQWKKGAMTWPDTTRGPTPEQRARWAERGFDPAAAEPPLEAAPRPQAEVRSPANPLPAPTPGFETYEMRGERLIVAAPGLDPVMLVLRDGKIALKKLG